MKSSLLLRVKNISFKKIEFHSNKSEIHSNKSEIKIHQNKKTDELCHHYSRRVGGGWPGGGWPVWFHFFQKQGIIKKLHPMIVRQYSHLKPVKYATSKAIMFQFVKQYIMINSIKSFWKINIQKSWIRAESKSFLVSKYLPFLCKKMSLEFAFW